MVESFKIWFNSVQNSTSYFSTADQRFDDLTLLYFWTCLISRNPHNRMYEAVFNGVHTWKGEIGSHGKASIEWQFNGTIISMLSLVENVLLDCYCSGMGANTLPTFHVSAEEAIREKLAAQVIQKEMNEADEANLLEEEDMHVFEWKPLTDPLNLVSCKTCRKPIKASQYAAHAERCKSLSASDDTGLELDGGTGHKRPPRKVRKKVQTAHENQVTAAGDQEISESFDGEDTCASESANVDDCHMGIASSLSREVKKSSIRSDGSLCVDGPGSVSCSEGAKSPSKRTKLLPIQSSLTSDNLDSTCGVTMESGTCCQGTLTCKLHSESSKRAVKGRRQVYDILLEEHNAKIVHRNVPKSKDDHSEDIPAPIATKIYYPRQNQRLRAVLGHLYRESLIKENSHKPSTPKRLSGDTGVQSGRTQILSADSDVTDQQKDLMDVKKQKELSAIPPMQKSEQMLPPNSEIGRTITNGHPAHINFQNQYHENKFGRSQLPMEVAPTGIMRNRFIKTPYTFTGNAGTSMGSMQQANGIVPVV